MKCYWTLAALAAAVLAAAAVWMGGLNQDEGWYVYAANLVAEGQMPYRDFFYTQGPVMPYVYSAFVGVWRHFGLLGARVFTLAIGLLSVAFAAALARRLAPDERRGEAAFVVFVLLGVNLYHLYYVAIPKTYALASLFVTMGFFLLSATGHGRIAMRAVAAIAAGLCLAFAAGTRISLGALLCVVGAWLLVSRRWRSLVCFCIGGFGGLALVYGPYLADEAARAGLLAAQAYHAARGGFDPVWTVGSFSRLIRWYLPLFIALGLGVPMLLKPGRRVQPLELPLFVGFLAVFAVQMLAPFPYEDYQVPVMALLAVVAATGYCRVECPRPLLALGLAFACAFGSPLLERWSMNGQDRFWSLKKSEGELSQLRKVAARIESMDPGGRELLTQDLYLAIETNRKVPRGLEMGPFAMLSDDAWRELLASATCPVAAMSGYTFAIEPPKCAERPVKQQVEYWTLLKKNYELVDREEAFGQNATPLLILKRK